MKARKRTGYSAMPKLEDHVRKTPIAKIPPRVEAPLQVQDHVRQTHIPHYVVARQPERVIETKILIIQEQPEREIPIQTVRIIKRPQRVIETKILSIRERPER